MFTGIVEDVGTVVEVRPRGNGRTLTVRTALPVGGAGIGLGDSIAVMGACLTAEDLAPPDRFTVACGAETLERTTLGGLAVGGRVHLERALQVGDRLDGHMVSGHVDAVGTLVGSRKQRESLVLHVRIPDDLARYVAPKGSICLDGVSLTVNEVAGSTFRVNIVPYTTEHTRLADLQPGDRMNVEVDIIARYLERLLGGPRPGLDRQRLVELGFAKAGHH